MRIRAHEACRFTDLSNITSSWRHDDIILKVWFQTSDQNIKIGLYAEF